ncbi:MAG: hypothetical protein KGZ25_11200, partial [Planctomycetes bacterium]|nr:hypothetical protein [Planctomycetota bacterium]
MSYFEGEIRFGLSAILFVCAAYLGVSAQPVSAFVLVEEGEASATVVLPEETEWDRYVNASEEEIETFARERFPNASEEKLAEVIQKMPDLRQREARRVGDEELLAAEELVE